MALGRVFVSVIDKSSGENAAESPMSAQSTTSDVVSHVKARANRHRDDDDQLRLTQFGVTVGDRR